MCRTARRDAFGGCDLGVDGPAQLITQRGHGVGRSPYGGSGLLRRHTVAQQKLTRGLRAASLPGLGECRQLIVLQSQRLLGRGRGRRQGRTVAVQRPEVQAVFGGVPVVHLADVCGEVRMLITQEPTGPHEFGKCLDRGLSPIQTCCDIDGLGHVSTHPGSRVGIRGDVPVGGAPQHRGDLTRSPGPLPQGRDALVERGPHRLTRVRVRPSGRRAVESQAHSDAGIDDLGDGIVLSCRLLQRRSVDARGSYLSHARFRRSRARSGSLRLTGR